MGLKWGIFWRMRGLVVQTQKMFLQIHTAVTNDIPHQLKDHEEHLKKQDEHMEMQDKKISHIERVLQIEPEDKNVET